eukprot:6204877-Pleurochrysis_carterae.AAC.3
MSHVFAHAELSRERACECRRIFASACVTVTSTRARTLVYAKNFSLLPLCFSWAWFNLQNQRLAVEHVAGTTAKPARFVFRHRCMGRDIAR